jgi:hypothetical protein
MRHGIGSWTQQHKVKSVKIHKDTNQMRKLAYENYTGSFMNNYFEGYGIFTVKYDILKKTLEEDSPKVAN